MQAQIFLVGFRIYLSLALQQYRAVVVGGRETVLMKLGAERADLRSHRIVVWHKLVGFLSMIRCMQKEISILVPGFQWGACVFIDSNPWQKLCIRPVVGQYITRSVIAIPSMDWLRMTFRMSLSDGETN